MKITLFGVNERKCKEQSIKQQHQQHQQPHVVHADNSHDGIMDLAHHSDSSN